MQRLWRLILATALAAFAGSLPAANDLRLPELGDPASRSLSIAQERQLGDRLMRQLRLRLPLTDDPELRHYINDLGQRLVAHADTPEFDYRFFVVDSGTITAFAMPGGHIGVNRGLIEATRSESELASVLAHEIAHVTQRHIARRMDEAGSSGLQTLGIILAAILLGSQDADLGGAAMMGGLAGSVQSQLNFSRAHEREADNLGIRILADANLDPQGMPRFFERLGQATRHQQRPPEFLSTHPLTEGRIAESLSRARDYGDVEVDESLTYGFMRARIIVARANEPQDAIRHFEAGQDDGVAWSDAATRYGLALARIDRGEHRAAIEALEAVMEAEGEHPSLFIALARAREGAGDPAAALETLELGLELFPHNYPLSIHIAEALLQRDRPMDARHRAREQIRHDGGDGALYRLHAEAASEAGLEHEGMLALAEHYYFEGDLRRALDQLDRVANAAAADVQQRSRAVSRRQAIQREIEREQG